MNSATTAALVAAAGYRADDPVVVGVRLPGRQPVFHCAGQTRAGSPVTPATVIYCASLSKQMTTAAAALLVRQGRLDVESALARWVPELPAWSRDVRLRHLISHTSGLPEGVFLDDAHRTEPHHTTAGVIRALTRINHPPDKPGTVYRYCNAGYICLAVAIERAASQPLPDFARERLFSPLGMDDTRFWSGPEQLTEIVEGGAGAGSDLPHPPSSEGGPPHPLGAEGGLPHPPSSEGGPPHPPGAEGGLLHPPGAAPLDPGCPPPFSLGDGGVWSTAQDLLRWNQALDSDELGISELLQTPGHLDDGTELSYAWAMDVRTQAGCRVYRHGGSWPGLTAQLVRVADRHASFVVLALDDDADRTGTLAHSLIEELARQP